MTLIEAVISMALLAVVIGGSYMVVTQSSSMIRQSRDHYVAINIARARFERMRNFPFDQLITLASTSTVDDSGLPCVTGLFQCVTTVETNYTSNPGLTKVTVRTDIRRSASRPFTNECESVACLFTEYLTR